MRFTASELATLRANLGLPADADATAIKAAMLGRRPPPPPVNLDPNDAPAPGEDPAEWGYRTGRYAADRIPMYRAQLNAAARHPGGREQMVNVIRSLTPVLAELRQARQSGPWVRDEQGRLTGQANQPWRDHRHSDTPLSDALDRAVYGPTTEERHREQDAAAEAELAAQLQAEHEAALAEPDPEAFGPLFGPSD